MIRVQPLPLVLMLAISVIAKVYVTPVSALQNATGEEPLKHLVVMIQSFMDDRASNGAGIIFGRQGSRLYIVTANHVVRMGVQQAQRVRVQFKWVPGEWWDARVLEHEDRDLDIAVLSVLGQELDIPDLEWRSWVPPEKLNPGAPVRPIGFPRGEPWYTPQQRHLFHSVTPLHTRSEGELDPGNSGGALVTDDWGIVGVVSQADRPYNRSSRIDRALDKLKEWGYHIDLSPKVPPEPPKIHSFTAHL
jgi:S1-C subfamily serine protease